MLLQEIMADLLAANKQSDRIDKKAAQEDDRFEQDQPLPAKKSANQSLDVITEKAEPVSINPSPNVKYLDGTAQANNDVRGSSRLLDTPKKQSRFNLTAF